MDTRLFKAHFALAKRPTYLRVNLDTILSNLEILRTHLGQRTEIIAVVKANAYGHGSVAVSRYLESHGFKHFAVATALEGEELRKAGVRGEIFVFGNGCEDEIPVLFDNRLIPTVCGTHFLAAWATYWRQFPQNGYISDESWHVGSVVIKVDTGMSRNGCQPGELADIVQYCNNNQIPIHSIMSHFAQSWDDEDFTRRQLHLFLDTVRPFRERGVKVQIANSGGIVNKMGVDLDYVRPGISMYGQSPDTSEYGVSMTQKLGLKPAISWVARASQVKRLSAGTPVGYDQTYRCEGEETIATIPIGYADGYLRNMFGQGFVTTSDGIPCPVVGRVSMDAITVKVPENAENCRHFCIISDDFNDVNSSYAVSKIMNTIPYEVCTNFHQRLPRLYEVSGQIHRTV